MNASQTIWLNAHAKILQVGCEAVQLHMELEAPSTMEKMSNGLFMAAGFKVTIVTKATILLFPGDTGWL